jgi:hypothetical protein
VNVLRRGTIPALVAAATLLALQPVLHNGFLVIGFDDDAFILDNPYIRALTWDNVWACLTRFYHYDYLPLPMLSYLVEFQLWGTRPAGYHVTNLLLHIVNATLVYAVAKRALGTPRAAAFAGLIFALHPVQLEAVSVIAQRKTLLATGFLLGALLAYQLYRAGRRWWYAVAVLSYACAGASKSSVMPFPFLLLLYDYTFHRSDWRVRDKLPFFALALATVWVSAASKVGTQVVKAPHGGSYLATGLAMSRVMWEYMDAMLLPLNLSPNYYYSAAGVFGLLNWVAAAALVLAVVMLTRSRQRFPLTCFFAGWVGLSLLPVANIVPIAVLRADRYLYLPMVAFALWAGWGLARARALSLGGRVQAMLVPLAYAAMVVLGVLSWQYAFVWRSDVTAWTRTFAHHPWSARPPYLLALAYEQRQEFEYARRLTVASIQLDPAFDRPYELLADLSRRVQDDAVPSDRGPEQRRTATVVQHADGRGAD